MDRLLGERGDSGRARRNSRAGLVDTGSAAPFPLLCQTVRLSVKFLVKAAVDRECDICEQHADVTRL